MEMGLLIDLHKDADRQGPGGTAETLKMIDLAGLDPTAPLEIADIGCGTGAATLTLAGRLNARITAVDFLDEFLGELETRASSKALRDNIFPLNCSMEDLPFGDDSLDVIWSEGAVYNMGFENGVGYWKRFLKPGGLLVISEITWLTESRPLEIQSHWEAEYPQMGTAASNFSILERFGYSPMAYFVLPEYCWLDNYYGPMERRFEEFIARHRDSDDARAIVEAEKKEIALYRKYRSYFGYGVYLARKAE